LSKNLFFLKVKLWKIRLLDNYFYSLNGGFLGGEVYKSPALKYRAGGQINYYFLNKAFNFWAKHDVRALKIKALKNKTLIKGGIIRGAKPPT